MPKEIPKVYEDRLENCIIVALDDMGKEETINTIQELGRKVWGYKLSNLLYAHGNKIFQEIQEKAGSVNLFLDLILSGPPKAIRGKIITCLRKPEAAEATFLSVNFTSGVRGIKAAVETARLSKVLVYSLDSSLSIADINFIYNTPFRYIQTFKAAQMVKEARAYGLYCAARELEFLSHPDFAEIGNIPTVAVGIRPDWYQNKGVHEFVMTPRQAIEMGATKIVIGSPITKAKNKLKAVERILREIRGAKQR